MRPKQQTSFYRSAVGGSQKHERDPYIFVLSGQVVLCLLAVLLAFVLRDMPAERWKPVSEQYLKLLTRPIDSEDWGWTEGLGQWYASWKERTLETVSHEIETLLAKRQPAMPSALPEAAEAGADESAPASPRVDLEQIDGMAQALNVGEVVPAFAPVLPDESLGLSLAFAPPASIESEQLLAGAGGWQEESVEMRSMPASCSFAPILLSARMTTPVGGQITSPFGWREHPISGKNDFHRGLDIAAPLGTGVRAALPGTVEEAGESEIYGNFITLLHSGGLRTTYSHCDTIKAKEGDCLRVGELLATVGSTGMSTGPHLHFEINKDGIYYNPLWVLPDVGRYGF